MAGKMSAWKLNGKRQLFAYNFGASLGDARQPALTRTGALLLGVANTVVAVGSAGGCTAGYRTGHIDDVSACMAARVQHTDRPPPPFRLVPAFSHA